MKTTGHGQFARTAAAVLILMAGSYGVQAQPRFGNPSPTAGTSTSQQANAAADSAAYQEVEYVNKSAKGPALVVIPGEVKSNNASFTQRFLPNNIADFGELELSSGELHRAGAQQSGQSAAGNLACLQSGRCGQGPQDDAGRQAEDDEVGREVRHHQGRAGRAEQPGVRRPGDSATSSEYWAAAGARRPRARPRALCRRGNRPAYG